MGFNMVTLSKRLFAGMFGTFWLVFGGCGSAVLAADFPNVGIGLVGVSLAYGLTLLTMAYSIGHISGCHLDPAVTVGLWDGGRFPGKDIAPYAAAQVLGAVFASLVLVLVARGAPDFVLGVNGLAANGYGKLSPGGYDLLSGPVVEVVLTFGFVMVILGATDTRSPSGFAPLAIGMVLTLIHRISIPVTNTSVNPARSTGPALIVGGLALHQLWLFWIAPIAGALAAGVGYRLLAGTVPAPPVVGEAL